MGSVKTNSKLVTMRMPHQRTMFLSTDSAFISCQIPHPVNFGKEKKKATLTQGKVQQAQLVPCLALKQHRTVQWGTGISTRHLTQHPPKPPPNAGGGQGRTFHFSLEDICLHFLAFSELPGFSFQPE